MLDQIKTFLDRHELKNIPPMQEDLEDSLQQYKSISQEREVVESLTGN